MENVVGPSTIYLSLGILYGEAYVDPQRMRLA